MTATFTSSYTHHVCFLCGSLLYCSEAEPWQPQTDYGWCPHDDDEDGAPVAVWTNPPDSAAWHRCGQSIANAIASWYSASYPFSRLRSQERAELARFIAERLGIKPPQSAVAESEPR